MNCQSWATVTNPLEDMFPDDPILALRRDRESQNVCQRNTQAQPHVSMTTKAWPLYICAPGLAKREAPLLLSQLEARLRRALYFLVGCLGRGAFAAHPSLISGHAPISALTRWRRTFLRLP